MTPDVNVLVAASRSDHPHQRVARAWLEQALVAAASGTAVSLMPMVLASFLRLVTNPKIFSMPTPIEKALALVDSLLAVRDVHLAALGAEWPRLRQLCLDKYLEGNDLPGAWLAAATSHIGEQLVSFDRVCARLIGRSQFTLLEPRP